MFGENETPLEILAVRRAAFGQHNCERRKFQRSRSYGAVLVTAGYFSVDATFTDAGKTIRQVRVTWISPDINKLKIGLRVGDSLVLVNQQPVVGMKSATLGDLFEIVLKAGEKRTFLFRGKRGLFGKDWFSTIIITRPDAEMPNHPTSPTTAQPPIQP